MSRSVRAVCITVIIWAHVAVVAGAQATVTLRVQPLADGPVPLLTQKDITVWIGAQRADYEFRPQDVGAKVPMQPMRFLLLDLAGHLGGPHLQVEEIAALKPLFTKGWRIGATDGAGHQTPYVANEADLEMALRQPAAFTPATPLQAVQAMRALSGRHAVLSYVTPGSTVWPPLVTAANDALAVLYAITPNAPPRNAASQAPSAFFQPVIGSGGLYQPVVGDNPTVVGNADVPSTLYVQHRPAHDLATFEPNLTQMRKDLLADGEEYTILEIPGYRPGEPLRLRVVPQGARGGRYSISAQAYAAVGPEPQVTLLP